MVIETPLYPLSLWERIVSLVGWRKVLRFPLSNVTGADSTLVGQVERRAVRAFIKAIDDYTLHRSRVIRVYSRYRIPPEPSFQQRVPEWLARRVRFYLGSIDSGKCVRIRSMDVHWNGSSTVLFLYLAREVKSGSTAVVAGRLDEQPCRLADFK